MIAPKKYDNVSVSEEDSIPRLELAAAVMLAKLMSRVRITLNVDLRECFLFSDATVVLCWLSKPPDEWKTFVSNRVSLIQNHVPYSQWFYISTRNNPAGAGSASVGGDCAARLPLVAGAMFSVDVFFF
jgi:hypothetical protein